MNMENFSIGDKVMLTTCFERYSKVGEVYEIGNIVENGFIIRDTHSKIAVGCINFNDFFLCFSKLEDRSWTDWAVATYNGDGEDVLIQYRTNGKRVEVKAFGCKRVASCMPDDKFNLSKGIYIAFLRCKLHKILKEHDELSSKYNENFLKIKEVRKSLQNTIS